ncbi:RluA family pseudouridine synthase [Sneathiella marina]|uniref:Pseudouridine synthase n=1 Tax=Sneathiella marina TaxID=2950108 RepID=A0ABY4WBL2_9PROT|nr:RluA family pseudouridine synthase [Sneathiella marina]USG63160.1 RluA family pseudouridine synthase [Sneathiella marina]
MFTYRPPSDPVQILYQDADLVVIDKPSGLLSAPGRGEDKQDCALSRCRLTVPGALLVHRLDMDTSGIMVLALNPTSHRHLSQQFEQRRIGKTYLAWVEGSIAEDSGKIDLPLLADWPNRPKQKIDRENGKPSLTRWQVLEHRAGATLLKLTPESGRTHQLRVHCEAIGHPVLGDRLYGSLKSRGRARRLQLHAQLLTFDHPRTAEPSEFLSPGDLTGPASHDTLSPISAP